MTNLGAIISVILLVAKLFGVFAFGWVFVFAPIAVGLVIDGAAFLLAIVFFRRTTRRMARDLRARR